MVEEESLPSGQSQIKEPDSSSSLINIRNMKDRINDIMSIDGRNNLIYLDSCTIREK